MKNRGMKGTRILIDYFIKNEMWDEAEEAIESLPEGRDKIDYLKKIYHLYATDESLVKNLLEIQRLLYKAQITKKFLEQEGVSEIIKDDIRFYLQKNLLEDARRTAKLLDELSKE